jgi:hypothetical protein
VLTSQISHEQPELTRARVKAHVLGKLSARRPATIIAIDATLIQPVGMSAKVADPAFGESL